MGWCVLLRAGLRHKPAFLVKRRSAKASAQQARLLGRKKVILDDRLNHLERKEAVHRELVGDKSEWTFTQIGGMTKENRATCKKYSMDWVTMPSSLNSAFMEGLNEKHQQSS